MSATTGEPQRAEPAERDRRAVSPGALRRSLLAWYDRHRRAMPWRALPGARPDPYHVWLSEIMLQQTTVATVGPYFRDFIARWPTVTALAAAELDQVLHAWQGLGYYARARNMHRAARVVADELGGCFPGEEEELRRLPGVGPYTAAAIAAIAFDRPTVPVDGNVERVMARLHGIATPLPEAKPTLVALARELGPANAAGRPGDFGQALMDLGATICAPRRPACPLCPWHTPCRARADGNAADLPRRSAKPVRPLRRGVAFWAVRGDGAVLLRRRPERGLLGGMIEVPSSEWREGEWNVAGAQANGPIAAAWQPLPGLVRHSFTHFDLELTVVAARVNGAAAEGIWCAPDRLGEHALPTLMKKVAAHALKQTLGRAAARK